MCGRYSITDPDEAIRSLFGYNGPPFDFAPRYNAAPTQSMPVVRLNHEGKRAIVAMRWGLIPSWAKEAKIGAMMINARADTVATKPAYRAAFKARHCLVLANGFYEWQAPPEGAPKGAKKQPYRIVLGSRERARPFAFAGLWERWRDPAAKKDAPPLDTFTIVTTDAAPAIAHIHDRMPAMLTTREQIEAWLDAEKTPPAEAQKLLRPYAGGDLAAYTVGLKVNNARYDGADCVAPAAPGSA
ncbi:MAG: SOS response-associated peptidase [Alphaproteobacteria bacterium]